MAVGIVQVDRAAGAAVEDLRALHSAGAQVLAPRVLLLGRLDEQREVVRRADAHDALRELGVLHEAQQLPGLAVERAEPHMAAVGIVVGRAVVDDREAEHVAVEGDRLLRVAADRRDVVQAAQLHALLIRHGGEASCATGAHVAPAG